ncbi:hypothetical protein KTQ54_13055 [Komagataeibacter oboediens]|uniref:glyoxalase superfamily protein n=1 Tax=Komagataeibacter oboediens TaxID=65958 RepID=UPI0019032226|nr:glyoxalase superfamily protein [Komagataeibacter oboediens]MBV0889457.1 hypothetical protein [Komagataeibacter oboediens]MCK9818994.1 glyoxalase superfamily protein [Komagataeibacter oboediens]GCE78967.1 AraC family transcriptional regulator [Komagataeibacter oboediens]
MQTPNPKMMARILRDGLAQRHLTISHATALELVARQLGYSDWNVLAARHEQETAPSGPAPTPHAGTTGDRLPDGWFASGRADLFRHDLLAGAGPGGVPAVLIESRASQPIGTIKPGDFVTIMQRISAARYRGKAVSFRARMCCNDATGSGRVWIHARGHGGERLAFDNLGLKRGAAGPITGTTGWTRRSVTIAVPEAAVYIGFGVLFGSGTGSFRAAELSFGLAEGDEHPQELPETPRNLDLGQMA